MSINKEDYLHMFEWVLMKNDVETLVQLHQAHEQPIFNLAFLPYYALFCQSFFDHCDLNDASVTFTQESAIKISDVRAALKLFHDGYKSNERKILSVDDIQDAEFKAQLRFPWLGRFNIHYNLGIYLDEKQHIISNTQYDTFVFQDRHCSNGSAGKDVAFNFGKGLGEVVGLVYAALAKVLPQINPSVRQVNIPLYYKDFNTNRNFDLYPHLENGKEITLRILHLLSAINFVRFVIRAMIPVENPWQLRIKYITLYYVWKSIEKIESTFKNEVRLHSLLDSIDGSSLLNAAFRSCMTHYGLSNKGQCAIKDECFDPNIPLFGLVESCYGMSYLALNSKIDAAIDSISDTLADRLPFDFSGLKAL